MSDKEKLYQKIQKLSFVLVELNLFLDTHPDNAAALEQYNKMLEKLKEATREYEEKYGSLTVAEKGANMKKGWDWVSTPWPWQMED